MHRRLFPQRSYNARHFRGFTLVELLVVIAIIGILIALLLPAVQAAREAARRMQCGNNLKQMGLAMHNYHDVHKCFPPGNISVTCGWTVNGWSNAHYVNWAISLLPYIELETLYDKYDHKAYNHAALNASVREHYVPVYACPSDPGVDVGPQVPLCGLPNLYGIRYQRGSYRAMAGRGGPPYPPDRGMWIGGGFQTLPANWKGVFHVICPQLAQCEKFSTVTDGTSSTLAIGERHTSSEIPSLDTFWAQSNAQSTSQAEPYSATLQATKLNSVCVPGVPRPRLCYLAWGSYHPGVINWLLCDGSVRPLSTNMNMFLFCDLATIAGGEPAQVP